MKFSKILLETYRVDSDSPRFSPPSAENTYKRPDHGRWSGSIEQLENLNNLMEKFHNGKIYIEFATSPEFGKKQNMKLIVKFEGDTSWLMNHKYSGPSRFESVEDLLWSMKDSFESNTQYVDLNTAYSYVFDYRAYQKVEAQIREFADNYPLKSKSLTYDKSHSLPGEKDSNWDMEIIFKRKMMGNKFQIQPSLSGDMNYGRIVGSSEIEVEDPTLFPKKKGFWKRNK